MPPSSPSAIAWLDIDADGRYVDASPSFLDAFGYSVEEVRRLRVGDFHDAAVAHAAKDVWADIVARGIHPMGGGARLHRADGVGVHIEQVALTREADDRWRSTFRILWTDQEPAPAIHVALARWRESERAVLALDTDDPRRTLAEATADRLRRAYREAYDRARSQLDGGRQDP
jgi:hypothetical protein